MYMHGEFVCYHENKLQLSYIYMYVCYIVLVELYSVKNKTLNVTKTLSLSYSTVARFITMLFIVDIL